MMSAPSAADNRLRTEYQRAVAWMNLGAMERHIFRRSLRADAYAGGNGCELRDRSAPPIKQDRLEESSSVAFSHTHRYPPS